MRLGLASGPMRLKGKPSGVGPICGRRRNRWHPLVMRPGLAIGSLEHQQHGHQDCTRCRDDQNAAADECRYRAERAGPQWTDEH